MTRRITNDEYLSLALRYNEQRTINDSLQREITELKEKNEFVNLLKRLDPANTSKYQEILN